jgi:endoglucanase
MIGITFALFTAVANASNIGARAVTKPPLPGNSQIILNGNFANGTTGWVSQPKGKIQNGQYCVSVPANAPTGNASYLRTSYTFLETKNDIYTLNFTASSTLSYEILARTPDPPLDPNLNQTAALKSTAKAFSMTFSPANQAPSASVEFDLGGNSAATTVCFENISMKRIDRSGYKQDVGPSIKVNQLGYLVKGPKRATFVTNSTTPQSWSLINESGDLCAQGRTTLFGRDAASGDNAQIIDFSTTKIAGNNYIIKVADESSFPFSISSTLYSGLYKDSLRWFYQQRSGIAIDGSLVGERYARAAGHVQKPPNTGDVRVPCQVTSDSLIAYLEPWTCNYTLDVTQGWYDAGDQGKYVVNGGISVAQLMMAYERSVYKNRNNKTVKLDNLQIPESHNGLPDILDEAKWELEFLVKMQVPPNSPTQLFNGSMIDVSGMAHHKMHDNQWTPLPTDPSQDPKRRELHRPSTAATLNLAAAGAMAARIYKPFDKAFAARCLHAATTAYAAAKRHPAILAPGTDWDLGGGSYSDGSVDDEMYWAASELFLTTGFAKYAHDLITSPYHTANVSTTFSLPSSFSWGSVSALGRLDLATIPSRIPQHSSIVRSVTTAADTYLSILHNTTNAYPSLLTHYSWGSSSTHLNAIQILATAYDLTSNRTYFSAALESLDYLLGRNALSQSYIVGYGTKSTLNVHSRLYAHELDASVPRAPAGSLAGGANQDASDPPADDVLQGCAPMKCYVDDVNSYSTNEVAVNWNSALVWVVAWAAGL